MVFDSRTGFVFTIVCNSFILFSRSFRTIGATKELHNHVVHRELD